MITARQSRGLSNEQFAFVLLVPALAAFALIIIVPLFWAFLMSFTEYSLINPAGGSVFVGLRNYISAFARAEFLASWRNAITFTLASTALEFVLGFTLALLLNQDIRFRNFLRGLALLPWITPVVVVGLLFMWMYNPQYGIINWALVSLGLIPEFKSWLGEGDLALGSLIAVNVWKFFPLHMVILLAGLQTVPLELYEAAAIDGANALQRFVKITVPFMRYIIFVVLLLQFIRNFQNFTLIWVTTKGGPGYSTTTLPVYIYKLAFEEWELAQAAAVGVMWLVFLALFSILLMRVMGRRVEVD